MGSIDNYQRGREKRVSHERERKGFAILVRLLFREGVGVFWESDAQTKFIPHTPYCHACYSFTASQPFLDGVRVFGIVLRQGAMLSGGAMCGCAGVSCLCV